MVDSEQYLRPDMGVEALSPIPLESAEREKSRVFQSRTIREGAHGSMK